MKRPRPRWVFSGIAAIALGVLIGVWLVPQLRVQGRIDDVIAENATTRTQAWTWWTAPDETGSPRAGAILGDLNRALAAGSDDAMLHGSDQLHRLDLWGWDTQPPQLVARHLHLLTWRAHVLDIEDAIVLIEAAPLDADPAHVVGPVQSLLGHPDPLVAEDVFNALVAWAGMHPRVHLVLDALPEARTAWGDDYRALLACGAQPIRIVSSSTTPYRATDADTDPADQVALAALMLEQLNVRRTSLGAISARLDDPDPNRRQVSALLAALLAHEDVEVAQAMLIEQHPRTRLTMRLALDAMGRPTSDDHPGEFAWRAVRLDDGRLWHPPILTRLIAGDPALLQPLYASALEDHPLDRAAAWNLTERFLPGWISADAGEGTTCESLELDAFFRRLLARWHLQRRWLQQDDSGQFHATGL